MISNEPDAESGVGVGGCGWGWGGGGVGVHHRAPNSFTTTVKGKVMKGQHNNANRICVFVLRA